jgi:hypothetical protein
MIDLSEMARELGRRGGSVTNQKYPGFLKKISTLGVEARRKLRTEKRKSYQNNDTGEQYLPQINTPWAKKAILRDGYKCVDCGKKNTLIVHHLDDSRKTGKLNNKLDNLVTVCRKCHAIRHGFVVRHPHIVELRDSGMTFVEISKVMGVTPQRIQQIYYAETKTDLV